MFNSTQSQRFQVGTVNVRFIEDSNDLPTWDQGWSEIADEVWPIPLFENILWDSFDIQAHVRAVIPLGDASFGSWLLARLLYLSGGTIPIMGCDENGLVMIDSGNLCSIFVVEALDGEALGLGYLGIYNEFQQIELRHCSERLEPNVFSRDFAVVLCADLKGLMVCRIDVGDFERPGWRTEFGWDGNRFLGRNTNS